MNDLNIRHYYDHIEDSRNTKTLEIVRILSKTLRNTSKKGENAFKPSINEKDFISFFDKIVKKYENISTEEFVEEKQLFSKKMN